MTKRTKAIILAVLAGVGGVLVAAGAIEPALLDAVTQAAMTLLDALSSGSVPAEVE